MTHESSMIPPPRRAAAQLNLTPMIDVVFQLLIYFLLGTSFVIGEQSYHMDLPERQGVAQINPLELDEDPLIIEVRHRPNNPPAIRVPGPWVSPKSVEELAEFLASRRIVNGGIFDEDHPIRIHPQSTATWGDAIEAFNAAVGAGYRKVGFDEGGDG